MTKTAASLLAAAALLALPAASHARTVGSDMARADASSGAAVCPGGPCTYAWTAEGWADADLADGSIVTSWSAKLTPNARARLRILRRNDDGTFTGAGASELVTGSAAGGVQTFRTHLAAPAGRTTIAVDLEAGGIGAVEDTGFGLDRLSPVLGAAETRGPSVHDGSEVLLNATWETDDDADGKGDETEDDCYFTCPASGGDPGGGGVSPAPASPAASPAPAPAAAGDREPDFSVDPRGLLRPAAQGAQGWFDVFVENGSDDELDATITVRAGKRSLGTKKLTALDSGDDDTQSFRLPAALRRTVQRKGRARLTVTATATLADGTRIPVRQGLTVVRGGDARYDGTYRGPGPFVIVVDHGAIRNISTSVNAFCPASNRFQMLSLFSVDGFPALVGRDGSFSADGSAVSQAIRYNGRLRLRGESKGYASVFKSQMNLNAAGKFFIDACQGATNWTVKRAAR